MENELNYLSGKIEELEIEISYYDRQVAKVENEKQRSNINEILERKQTDLELLLNIINALTVTQLT